MTKTEYRVVTKREGAPEYSREFKTIAGAQRRLALFGPEPWKAFGKGPTDFVCCNGNDCYCEGETMEQRNKRIRENVEPMEYIKIQMREVTEWHD